MKTKFVSPDAQGALGILIPAIPGVFDIALAPSRRHGAGRHGTSRETRNQQNTLCLDDDGFATQTGVATRRTTTPRSRCCAPGTAPTHISPPAASTSGPTDRTTRASSARPRSIAPCNSCTR